MTAQGDQGMAWTHADPGYVPSEIDTTKPSVARVYDAILGGKDNFAVDRVVAEEAKLMLGGVGRKTNSETRSRSDHPFGKMV